MNHLENLGDQFTVRIDADEDGYVGRECPVKECLGYFKITPGAGITGPAPCHCPYCGHSGSSDTFFTQAQIEYAQSVVMREVMDAVHKDLKALEFDYKPQGLLGIGISMTVEESAPLPIRYYRENQLETEIVCDSCSLKYAIYGVCPDCGIHNSLQILTKNLELARKELVLAESSDMQLAEHLVGDALENAVSAFDGYGREVCSAKGSDIRFQNLAAARKKVLETFGFDFIDVLGSGEWDSACRAFQKRHLLAHKMGVIDEEYVQKTSDRTAVAGRKVNVTPDEVYSAISIVERLGRRLFVGLFSTPPK